MPFRSFGARRRLTALWLFLFVLNACSGAGTATEPSAPSLGAIREDAQIIGTDEAINLEQLLREDADAQAIMRISEALADRASAQGIAKSTYTEAIKSQGIGGAAAVLGLSRAEFGGIAQDFQDHMLSLFQRYPVLGQLGAGTAVLAAPSTDGTIALAQAEEGGCKWLQYLACLALCTQTGPLYIACALLCWCGLCTDAAGNPWGVCEF